MIKIIILKKLRDEIVKIFKKKAYSVYSFLEKLRDNPNKGKVIGHVGTISIRELKLKSYRFYFIINSNQLILFNKKQLEDLLIRFVAMSKKNNQQRTIDELKQILKLLK